MALLALAAFAGCGRGPIAFKQSADTTYARSFSDPPTRPRRATVDPGSSFSIPWFPHLRLVRRSAEEKLHPAIRRMIAAGDARRIRVLVGFRDDVPMKRFPVEELNAQRFGRSGIHADSTALKMRDTLMAARAPAYRRERLLLTSSPYGATVIDSLWLSQCLVVETTAGVALEMAKRWEVVSIVPQHTGSRPPQPPVDQASIDHPIREARERIGSDAYAQAGYAVGGIRLMDTGVTPVSKTFDRLMPMLSSSIPVASLDRFDCLGSPDCSGPNPGDAVPLTGHGTATAGILVGRGVPAGDNDTHGVTDAALAAFRVYGLDDYGYMDFDPIAYGYAFQSYPTLPTQVIAVEVQDHSGAEDQVCRLANDAFAAGMCVVAANGNMGAFDANANGVTGSMAPGIARWVLGIGCRQVYDTTPSASQDESYGAVNGRAKPDVQFPTYTVSAGTSGPDATFTHTMTSGATPYAAAMALIVRNWLGPAYSVVDPGQVYSMMVALGETTREADGQPFPAPLGAGVVRLPSAGSAWYGADDLGTLATQPHDILITDPTVTHVRAALWWPDPEPAPLLDGSLATHYDFDVEIERLNHDEQAKSKGEDGVFERAEVSGTQPLNGTWRVKVHAANVGLGTGRVYWSFVATP